MKRKKNKHGEHTEEGDSQESEGKQSFGRQFLGTLKVLAFNADGFKNMVAMSSWLFAALFFIICVAFQSMPTSGDEIALFLNMFGFFIVKFIICLAVIFLFCKLMGSKTSLKAFVFASSLTYTYAMIVTTVLVYLSILLFDMAFKVSVISGVVQSFIPYYTSVLFGWGVESIANVEKRWKAVVIGLFAITFLLIYILYIDPWLCQIGFTSMFGISQLPAFCGV